LQPGSYGGTLEQFNTAHRNRVRPLVMSYLATVPQAEIAEVIELAGCVARQKSSFGKPYCAVLFCEMCEWNEGHVWT
jgi:hypothetical protein